MEAHRRIHTHRQRTDKLYAKRREKTTGGLGWMASLNVQNALDNIYISDGFETFVTNPQTGVKEQGTVENGKLEGYWAYGRTFSATLKMMF